MTKEQHKLEIRKALKESNRVRIAELMSAYFKKYLTPSVEKNEPNYNQTFDGKLFQ